MAVADIASAIVNALLAPISALLGSLPGNLATAFSNMFFVTEGSTQSITPFAIVMLVFGGVALAFGLVHLVFRLITRKVG